MEKRKPRQELVTVGSTQEATVQRMIARTEIPPGATIVYVDPSSGVQKAEREVRPC